MNNKIKYILKKEIREIFRDKRSLKMMLIIPLMISKNVQVKMVNNY